MSQQAQLMASKDEPAITFDKLWPTVKELGPRMLGLYLLIALYVIGGLIFFIVPGFIMLRRYFMAPYVMLETKCGIKDAMERSAELTKPFSGAVWGVIGVMVLFAMLNAIPYIGWLISFALSCAYSVAPAMRYQELKRAHAQFE